MKAIAYSIRPQEKKLLALANGKKHDLTLISNELNAYTVSYALGKEVVIVSPQDRLDRTILRALKSAGIKHIITRSQTTTHIDLHVATHLGLKVANAPDDDSSTAGIAYQTIRNLSAWEAGKCVGRACCCQHTCEVAEKRGNQTTEAKRSGYGS